MPTRETFDVAVVGGGPAGLMAAEVAARARASVVVLERGRTPGRKFLLAGRSGLNLTHSEELRRFLARYGENAARLEPIVSAFDPNALRQWADGLGEPTVIGTSGRVFPASWRAAPLLRAWLRRLDSMGVVIRNTTEWTGFVGHGPSITVEGAGGPAVIESRSTILACGGASWPRTGSDGSWSSVLSGLGIPSVELRSSNAELSVPWSASMARRFGEPVKDVVVRVHLTNRPPLASRGDLVIVGNGVQGSPAYTLASAVGRALADDGAPPVVTVDLRPDQSLDDLRDRLAQRRSGESTTNLLRRVLRLSPAAIALANEVQRTPSNAHGLASHLKAVPLNVTGTGPIDRAISSSGGVPWEALDDQLRVRGLSNVFAAGEMIDWDAPTGGYLLQACFSTGVWAGAHAAEAARRVGQSPG